jgi:hypothetical protein
MLNLEKTGIPAEKYDGKLIPKPLNPKEYRCNHYISSTELSKNFDSSEEYCCYSCANSRTVFVEENIYWVCKNEEPLIL